MKSFASALNAAACRTSRPQCRRDGHLGSFWPGPSAGQVSITLTILSIAIAEPPVNGSIRGSKRHSGPRRRDQRDACPFKF
jgi:hypothetical protein